MSRKDKESGPSTGGAPFNNPFGTLADKRASLPSSPVQVTPPSEPAGPARAVVRMERKGRGGKEVTVVEQLELPAQKLEEWLKALKRSLGCGGVVEERALVLQGDHREQLPKLLAARGVRKISVG